MRPSCGWIAMVVALAACQPLPSIDYETDNLQLATDFDAPVCGATLTQLDRAAARISHAVATTNRTDPYRVYWLEHELHDHCDEDTSGCFYPGTRIVFAHGPSIAHELVHAAVDSPGQGFFVEEGLAELYSGRAIRQDPNNLIGRLGSQLALSRRDYRHGELSYPQAAHFAHWLRDQEGTGGVQRMASVLIHGGDHEQMQRQLEATFDQSVAEIEQDYADLAPRYFEGMYDDDIATIALDENALWAGVTLRCDSEDVYGPLPDGEPGMFRLLRLTVREQQDRRIRLDGDTNTWAEILDPDLAARSRPPWSPPMTPECRLARLQPGDSTTLRLNPGTYLLVLGTYETSRSRVDLQFLR